MELNKPWDNSGILEFEDFLVIDDVEESSDIVENKITESSINNSWIGTIIRSNEDHVIDKYGNVLFDLIPCDGSTVEVDSYPFLIAKLRAKVTETESSFITDLNEPSSICWDGEYYYITDKENKDINKYTQDGTFVSKFADLSYLSVSPQGICWDGTSFWIIFTNNKIFQMNSSGELTLRLFDASREVGSAQGIAFDGEFFWIVDYNTVRVYKYSHSGVFTGFSFSVNQRGNRPTSIALDGNYFWITNSGKNKAYKYTRSGTYTGNSFSISDSVQGIIWDGSELRTIDSNSSGTVGYESKFTLPNIPIPLGGIPYKVIVDKAGE